MNPKPPSPPPKPPAPPAVMASTPWSSDLTVELAAAFGASITEFSTYAGQDFLVCESAAVFAIAEFLKSRDFDYLVDITAVDYPNKDERFELVYILYSFTHNCRVRIKARLREGYHPESLTPLFPAANWLEREIFDMFGIQFSNHPDMRRILMPDDWTGHPLRKDYRLRGVDSDWVKQNLGIEGGQ